MADTPTTEAGKRLLREKHWNLHAPLRGCVEPCSVAMMLAAIEAEAREQNLKEYTEALRGLERARIRREVEALLSNGPPFNEYERIANTAADDTVLAVLAILDPEPITDPGNHHVGVGK